MSTDNKKLVLTVSSKNLDNNQTNFPVNLYNTKINTATLQNNDIDNQLLINEQKKIITDHQRELGCINQKKYKTKIEPFIQIARLPTLNDRLKQTLLSSLSKVFKENNINDIILDCLIEKWCIELSIATSLNIEYLNENMLSIKNNNNINCKK